MSLIVRDTLGRETLVRENYYVATAMLRAGLHDYSYEIGFLRRDYSQASFRYGAPMASATHRLGLTDSLTVEAHAEGSTRTQAAGMAVDLGLPGIGLTSGSAAASRSDAGAGAKFGLGFQSGSRAFSFGAQGDYSSGGYRSVGMEGIGPPPRVNARVFVGLPTRFGALGMSYLYRDSRRGEADSEYLSANASIRLGRFGSLHLAGRRNLRRGNDIAAEASFGMALGGRTHGQVGLRREDGRFRATADLRRNQPVGDGWGYRASAALDNGRRLNGGLSLRTGVGDYDAALDYSGGAVAARFVAGGAIAVLGRNVFASRRLSGGFATVNVGNYANVRVYADNHLVARTDRHGNAVVPHLRSYERNSIRIELADLPLDAATTAPETSVRPFGRSGVAIDFRARRSRSALLRVEVEGLGALPPGATARVQGQDFLAAPGGQIFLSGLTDSNLVEVSWPDGSCSFTLDLSEGDDPQPDLGFRSCTPPQISAAR